MEETVFKRIFMIKIKDFWERFQLIRIRRYLGDGYFMKAEKLLSKQSKKQKKPHLFQISKADLLFSTDKLKDALAAFEQAIVMLDNLNDGTDQDNIYFLTAYSDFRRISVEKELQGEYFDDWQAIAKAIMSMPASDKLKRYFYIRY